MDLSKIITENEPLARHTYFRIGGPAKYFVEPRTEDELAAVLARFGEEGEDIHVLGGGTNLLVSDDGIDGVVIHLGEEFSVCEFQEGTTRAIVAAAYPLSAVVRKSVERGLAGLEGVIGVPGTFGGAALMNAGGKYGNVGDVITSVVVMNYDGSVHRIERDELEFTYRSSNIPGIVLRAELGFVRGATDHLSAKMKEVLQQKRDSQPLSAKSAGCVFKNPPGGSAGALVDQLGFKGVTVGGAQVSTKHANFIINTGAATAANVLELVDKIRDKVKGAFGLDLELEVRLWGFS